MYFVNTNAVETIARVGGVSHPEKTKNVENFMFSELLRCTVDRIDHIHMYFVNTNAVRTIARVGGVPPPRKKEKC